MNVSLRYDKGLGNSEVYARIVNGTQFYDFSATSWAGSETVGCRAFLTEYPDSSASLSWYAGVIPPVPAGGPYGIDIVRVSNSEVIGNDFITQSTDTVLPLPAYSTHAQDIFDVVLQRLANIKKPIQLDFFSSLNAAVDIIFRRLMVRKSEIVQGPFSQAITAPAATVTLPADFFGFCERPYLSGSTTLLDPLPTEARSQITSPGTPRCYELRGKTCTLYPTPSANCTVVGQYFKKPSRITLLGDGIPFDGLFDFAIQEAVIDICLVGMAVLVDKNFTGILYKQIDEILPFRAPRQVRFCQTVEHGQRRGGISPNYWY